MKISELENGMSNVEIEAKVVDKSEKRLVMTKYGRREVARVLLEDETGQINLTLWGKDIDLVSVGDKVKITGAFVTEFRDELQLNVPRSGRIEVIK
jgi:ssDNA-binding replication factor A large subunit